MIFLLRLKKFLNSKVFYELLRFLFFGLLSKNDFKEMKQGRLLEIEQQYDDKIKKIQEKRKNNGIIGFFKLGLYELKRTFSKKSNT